MAKKKSGEKGAESRDVKAAAEHPNAPEAAAEETLVEAATPGYVAEEAAFLAAEVQAFLDRRTELTARLAREIEATERRLEELRHSLALLSPPLPGVPAEQAKPEKKAKKPAPKKAEKKNERKSDVGDDSPARASDSAGDDATAANPQANDGAAA